MENEKQKAEPPADLSEAARKIWVEISETAEIDAPGRILLDELCRQFDLLQAARAEVAKNGILVSGRFGKKSNPANQIVRDASAAMLRNWRALGFDLAPAGQQKMLFGEQE